MITLFLINFIKTTGKFIAAFVALLVSGKEAIAQGISYRVSNPNHTGEWYNNANNKVVGRFNDSLKLEFMPPSIVFSGMAATADAGNPTGSMIWSDGAGNMKHTLMSNISVPISTVQHLQDSLDSRIRSAAFSSLFTAALTMGAITSALGYTPVPCTTMLTINGVSHDLSASNSWSVGTLVGSDTTPLHNQIVANTSAIATKYTIPAGSTSQYVKGDGSLGTFPAIPSGTVTSIGVTSTDLSVSGSPVTSSGNITLNLNTSGATAGTYEFITINNKGIVTGGYNSALNPLSTRTFGTAYQASNTSRIYDIDGTVKISVGTALITASDGQIMLDISPNGTTGWVEYTRTQNNNGGVLSAQNGQTGYMEAKYIPAGYYYRFNSTTTTGTCTFTWVEGHELLRK